MTLTQLLLDLAIIWITVNRFQWILSQEHVSGQSGFQNCWVGSIARIPRDQRSSEQSAITYEHLTGSRSRAHGLKLKLSNMLLHKIIMHCFNNRDMHENSAIWCNGCIWVCNVNLNHSLYCLDTEAVNMTTDLGQQHPSVAWYSMSPGNWHADTVHNIDYKASENKAPHFHKSNCDPDWGPFL